MKKLNHLKNRNSWKHRFRLTEKELDGAPTTTFFIIFLLSVIGWVFVLAFTMDN